MARAYSVLDALSVEITCVHPGDPSASHLVIRELRKGTGSDARSVLRALADVADLADLVGCSREEGVYSDGLCDVDEV